ncbi:unnamed protein product, partial [Prorocentrum cordatum]
VGRVDPWHLPRRCHAPNVITKHLSWMSYVSIYVAICLAQSFPVGAVHSYTRRTMGELAPAAWMQATADAMRAFGDHASEEQSVKHAKGQGEKGGKDGMTALVLLLLTKRCLSSSRELANLAGTVFQTWELAESGGGITEIMIQSGIKCGAAASLYLINTAAVFLDGKPEYIEGENKKFHEYVTKYAQAAEPTTVGKLVLHFRYRVYKGKKN